MIMSEEGVENWKITPKVMDWLYEHNIFVDTMWLAAERVERIGWIQLSHQKLSNKEELVEKLRKQWKIPEGI